MTFVDTVMLDLSDPAALRNLVFPPGDAARVRQLLATAYALPAAVLHDVVAVEVLDVEFQWPLYPPQRWTGSWTQTMPSSLRTEVAYERADRRDPAWVDVAARLAVTAVLEVDAGAVESISITDLGEFTTLGEFRAKFAFFDLDAFLQEEGITTVEQLRAAYRYLLGRIQLRPMPAFDPASPAHQRRFDLAVAVLVRDEVDLAGCLRAARLARDTAEQALAWRRETNLATVRTPYAPVRVLPAGSLAEPGPSQQQVEQFFRRQDVPAIFVER